MGSLPASACRGAGEERERQTESASPDQAFVTGEPDKLNIHSIYMWL